MADIAKCVLYPLCCWSWWLALPSVSSLYCLCCWSKWWLTFHVCLVTFVMGPLLGDLIRLYCISVLTKKTTCSYYQWTLVCSLVTFLQGCTVHRRPNRYCCISGVYMVTFVMGPPLGDLCSGDLCNGPSTNMILLHRTPKNPLCCWSK